MVYFMNMYMHIHMYLYVIEMQMKCYSPYWLSHVKQNRDSTPRQANRIFEDSSVAAAAAAAEMMMVMKICNHN